LLREQEFGDWNTLTEAEMERENPRRFIALKQAKDVYNKFYFRSPTMHHSAPAVFDLLMPPSLPPPGTRTVKAAPTSRSA
jgi:hypothetical protein